MDSIDWNETIFSQGTMNEIMNEEIFEEGNASVRKEVNCAPRKKARAKDSLHYKKQKTKAFNQQYLYEIDQLSQDSFQLKNKDKNKKDNGGHNVKIVTFHFEEKEVRCTCEAWTTEKLYKTKADEVCKDVPLVVFKCDKKYAELYHGNRTLTEKDVHKLTNILKTFDAQRKIVNEDTPVDKPMKKTTSKKGEDGDKYLTKKTLLKIYIRPIFHQRGSPCFCTTKLLVW